MKLINLLLVFALLSFVFSCQQGEVKKEVAIETKLDSISYGFGITIGENLKKERLDEINVDVLVMAISDILKNKELKIASDEATSKLREYFMKREEIKYGKFMKEGKEFLAKNSKEAGVITLESGLQYKIIKEGTGDKPKLSDLVTTHYHGTFIDGKVFDSSVDKGTPATFPVNGVISGWTEALQLMSVGSKWKLFVPSELAYGANPDPRSPIPPHSTLIFEVELLSIQAHKDANMKKETTKEHIKKHLKLNKE